MYLVVGRDAAGGMRELRLNASTEEEARTIAHEGGLIAIDRVQRVASLQASSSQKTSGFTFGVLGTLGCLASTIMGALVGYMIGNVTDRGFIEVGWLIGSVVGAIIGLIIGVSILVKLALGRR